MTVIQIILMMVGSVLFGMCLGIGLRYKGLWEEPIGTLHFYETKDESSLFLEVDKDQLSHLHKNRIVKIRIRHESR